MILFLCYLTLLFPVVSAAGWDDFSNNLATDLAPFVSLFGEQMTKQYMSESITMLDYFIFAMAPMGILTAVVSAIRVCGSAPLRAFVGRAQEGGGNAEAELCSSTSRDVCELYNNGGIARVFGRPKILEIVFEPNAREVVERLDTGNDAGIHTFQEYVKRPSSQEEWVIPKGFWLESNPERYAPNLSLNIGIKRRSFKVFVGVAVLGVFLQVGVLAFAVAVTYVLQWEKDGQQPESYACPLTIIGTVFVCSGIYLCAFIVGQSTKEYVFSRKNIVEQKDRSIIYWVQPGPQILGDQTFDSFCYSDRKKALQQYTTSWKRSKKTEFAVWVAVGITVSGFVLQFVGLRGIHSTISVAQLGATLLMSAARGALRMERLDSDDNLFADCQDKIVGHELDWLAIHFGQPGTGSPGIKAGLRPVWFWRFSGAVFDPNNSQMIGHGSLPSHNGSNLAGRIFAYRSRLAELTESPAKENSDELARNFKTQMVEIRSAAGRLTVAIETTFNMIFAGALRDKEGWKDAESAFLRLRCSVSTTIEQPSRFKDVLGDQDMHDVYIELCRQSTDPKDAGSVWKLKKGCEFEAILGLWVWSMKSDLDLTKTLDLRNRSIFGAWRIISWGEDPDRTGLMVWLPSKILCVGNEVKLKESDIGDSNILWKRTTYARTSNEPSGRPILFESLTKERLGRFPLQNTHRLFGWHVRERVTLAHPDTEAVPIWTMPTTSTLLSLCAQEIFAASVKSMLSVVNSIRDIEIVEEYQEFGLSNRLFSDIADEFAAAGLGSRDEGFLCILPHLVWREFREGRTPLLYAAKLGHAPMVERLLERGNFDPSLSDREGGTPLWWAAKNGHEVVVQQLLDDYSTDPDSGDVDRRTPLLCAAENGHEGVVRRLLGDARVVPNQQDRTGATPLSCAAAKGHETIVKLLLDVGKADLNLANLAGSTPLSLAAANGRETVVKVLLSKPGIEPDLKDSNGMTPLSHAASNGHEEVVRLLLANRNVDADSRELQGRTPIFHAALNKHEGVVKLLNDKLNPVSMVPAAQESSGDERYLLVLRHPLLQQLLTTRQTTVFRPVPR